MLTRRLYFTLLATIACSPAALNAADDAKMIVRVYPVGNLVRSVPDYPYRPGLPTTDSRSSATSNPAPSSVNVGGGGFNPVGSSGRGFFQIGDGAVPPGVVIGSAPEKWIDKNIDIFVLMEAIKSAIAPLTWTGMGGDGTIAPLGHSLVVRQTEEVHAEITKLIEALSKQSDNQTMLTVQAYLLTAAESDEMATDQRLAELPSAAVPIGQITCFSGQQVYLASGEVRNVVTSLIPVVSAVAVGYQPQIAYPHIGTLLELKTTIEPGKADTAMMDVRCTITDWLDGGEPIRFITEYGPGKASSVAEEGKGGRNEATIDRVNIATQQLATTVRVPVTSEASPNPIPVVVGSIGSPRQTDADATSGLTRLVVIVTRR